MSALHTGRLWLTTKYHTSIVREFSHTAGYDIVSSDAHAVQRKEGVLLQAFSLRRLSMSQEIGRVGAFTCAVEQAHACGRAAVALLISQIWGAPSGACNIIGSGLPEGKVQVRDAVYYTWEKRHICPCCAGCVWNILPDAHAISAISVMRSWMEDTAGRGSLPVRAVTVSPCSPSAGRIWAGKTPAVPVIFSP